MKKVAIRVFNFIIMAIAAVATMFLFISTTLSFNSNIALNVKTFSKFVPTTEYSSNIDIPALLGTNEIHVGIKFSLDINGVKSVMDGNRQVVDEKILTQNVNEITHTLHEPIDLITDFTIRSVLKSKIKEEVSKQVQAAIEAAHSTSTVEDIVEGEMGDQYFTDFANALYNSANEDDATVDSVSDVLYWQIDEALKKADGGEDGLYSSNFGEEQRSQIRDNLVSALEALKLVEDPATGKLKKISHISYMYISDYLKTELQTKVSDPTTLEQGATEALPDYADRLLNTFVLTMMPDLFYQSVQYVSLGLFIGLFVFAGIWVLLFVITLIRTFTKKPWTIFGPWFWIIGSLQLILGLGITVFGKFIVPNLTIDFTGLPISSIILAPRTYALIPSIFFGACIILASVYGIIVSNLKKEMKKEAVKQAKEKEAAKE